jgi:hypothetical protein
MIYIFRAEYILLLTLTDPNSGPRAGCPLVIYIHTINFCKNCRSLVKYALTGGLIHSRYLVSRLIFNNFPLPLHRLAR